MPSGMDVALLAGKKRRPMNQNSYCGRLKQVFRNSTESRTTMYSPGYNDSYYSEGAYTGTVNIVLVDYFLLFREGLKSLFASTPNVKVIGEAPDGRSGIDLIRASEPDIVVTDITLPKLNGIDLAREIRSFNHEIGILALSNRTEKHFVRSMLEAGALGYILKTCSFKELLAAVRATVRREPYLAPEIADVLVQDFLGRSQKKRRCAFNVLTPREREVLQLVSEGQMTKEIAKNLHVCERTIETHRQRIMSKLELHSIADITKYAIREGLTTIDA